MVSHGNTKVLTKIFYQGALKNAWIGHNLKNILNLMVLSKLINSKKDY